MSFCKKCTCTYTAPSCTGCKCLGVPNIYVEDNLMPCGSLIEVPLKGVDTCICEGTPAQIEVISFSSNIEVVSISLDRMIIKSSDTFVGTNYEINYKVFCGGYSSQGNVKGNIRDLCNGMQNCDPCTGSPYTVGQIDINVTEGGSTTTPPTTGTINLNVNN